MTIKNKRKKAKKILNYKLWGNPRFKTWHSTLVTENHLNIFYNDNKK
jgi:hypothetical protein